MKKQRWWIGAVLISALGCNSGEQPVGQQVEKVAETPNNENATVTAFNKLERTAARDNSFNVTADRGATIPESFPTDIYIPANAKVVFEMNHNKGTTIGLNSNDTIVDLVQQYSEETAKYGWMEASKTGMEQKKTIVYDKEDQWLTVIVFPNKRGIGTDVQLHLSPKKN